MLQKDVGGVESEGGLRELQLGDTSHKLEYLLKQQQNNMNINTVDFSSSILTLRYSELEDYRLKLLKPQEL